MTEAKQKLELLVKQKELKALRKQVEMELGLLPAFPAVDFAAEMQQIAEMTRLQIPIPGITAGLTVQRIFDDALRAQKSVLDIR